VVRKVPRSMSFTDDVMGKRFAGSLLLILTLFLLIGFSQPGTSGTHPRVETSAPASAPDISRTNF